MTAPWGPAAVRLMAWLASEPTAYDWAGHDSEGPRETAWRLGCDTGRAVGPPVATRRAAKRRSASPSEAPGLLRASETVSDGAA